MAKTKRKAKAKAKAKPRPAKRKKAAKKLKPAKKAKKPANKPRKPAKKAKPAGIAVGRDRLLAALDAISARLAADPIFAHESNAPFDRGELAGYFATDTTLEELFSETLQGMIQSTRFAGLHVVREAFRGTTVTTELPLLRIDEGATVAVVGDLVVDGDVVNDGVLVVTGDLTVRGDYVGPAWTYSLAAVGGTLRARHVTSSGEILVGDRLDASGVLHLFYNDYSSILPVAKARVLIVDDNYPAIGAVEVDQRFDHIPSSDELRTIFGSAAAVEPESSDEDSATRIRRLMRPE